jgi:hypothetical protein
LCAGGDFKFNVLNCAQVLLNVLNCLLDLDIIEMADKEDSHDNTPPPNTPESPDQQSTDSMQNGGDCQKNGITAHSLAMDSLFRWEI